MVVDREHAEKYALGFADNPVHFISHSYVNMYLHHDGYPEWQGVQLANWIHTNGRIDGSAMAEYLLEHGMIDIVVHRKELRETLSKVLSFLKK